MEAKLELGDDAEVPSSAAEAPEEVGVLCCTGRDEVARGGDEIRGEELVYREPELAVKPADSTAERQAGDAGVSDDSASRRKPERLRLTVELSPEHACLDSRGARHRVDADPFHWPEIDHDPAVADRVARIAVPTPSDCEGQGGLAGEPDRRPDVRNPAAARDESGVAIDRSVPDPAVSVVRAIAGADELALEGFAHPA